MMIAYLLLRQLPTETSDPDTKTHLKLLPIILHIFGEVLTTIFEILMGCIIIDSLFDGMIPILDMKECLMDYAVNGLMVMVPGICVLITGLIYSGLLVESR